MNLGILQCDKVSKVFESEHGQYPGMFEQLLLPADPDLHCTVFDVEQGVLPKDIQAADAYLITGSRHGVNDGLPWIAELEAFIKRAEKAHKKIVGICFGHQLIAKALGGKVIKSPKGWGVGVSQNRMVQHKNWMNLKPNHFNLLVSHQDQVVELPEHAEVLAASDFCPYYMLQIKDNFLTIQGHPEFSKSYSQALMVSREDSIDEQRFEQGMSSLDLSIDEALIAKWIINFLQA